MPNHGTGPKSGLCRERGKRSGLTSTARPQAMCWTRRPAAAAAAVVTAAAALPCHSCSTLWRDPETRAAPCRGPASGAMPLPCAWLVCCYRAMKRRRP